MVFLANSLINFSKLCQLVEHRVLAYLLRIQVEHVLDGLLLLCLEGSHHAHGIGVLDAQIFLEFGVDSIDEVSSSVYVLYVRGLLEFLIFNLLEHAFEFFLKPDSLLPIVIIFLL